jgi:hypothetical protein
VARPDGSGGLLVSPPGLDATRPLGWQVAAWCELFLRHGPGDVQGESLRLDDEFRAFIVSAYAINDLGRRLVNRAVLSRPKGRAKSELAGILCCAELLGPVRFDHWAARGEVSEWGYEFEEGEPVGVPVRSPFIRCLATEEGQSGNTFDNCAVMLDHAATAWPERFGGLDIGRNAQTSTRIFLAGGGEIRPSTAASASKDGGKETFAVADETHLYQLPELKTMHRTVSRNLVKRKAGEPWMLETSTMYAPGEFTVAEESHKHAAQIVAGEASNRGFLFDHREGSIEFDWHDDVALRAALAEAYGSAVEWMDLDRIVAEIRSPHTLPEDAKRYFLNVATSDARAAVDLEVWAAAARPARELERREVIGVGFDGSYSNDSTALVGCTADGFVFEIAAWDRPHGARDWTVPRDQVQTAVEDTFRRYKVGRMLCDPPLWQSEEAAWAGRWGDEKVLAFETNRPHRMAPACERFATAVTEGVLTHDGTELLTRHVANMARKKVRINDDDQDGRTRFVFVTAGTGKIDRGIAAVLAYEAAMTMPKAAKSRIVSMAAVMAGLEATSSATA